MDDPRRNTLREQVRFAQLLVASLALGVVAFGFVAIILNDEPLRLVSGPLGLVALASALASIPASFLVPGLIASANRRRIADGTWQAGGSDQAPQALAALGEDGKWMPARLTGTIIGAALLEGAAFLGLVALMIEGSLIGIGVALVALFFIALRYPTVTSTEAWIESQHRAMQEDQLLRR